MITYSSLEHSGLGRYGDSLNPWGDLITMAKAWCLLKPKGRALSKYLLIKLILITWMSQINVVLRLLCTSE